MAVERFRSESICFEGRPRVLPSKLLLSEGAVLWRRRTYALPATCTGTSAGKGARLRMTTQARTSVATQKPLEEIRITTGVARPV
jgi:hypothetical protein